MTIMTKGKKTNISKAENSVRKPTGNKNSIPNKFLTKDKCIINL